MNETYGKKTTISLTTNQYVFSSENKLHNINTSIWYYTWINSLICGFADSKLCSKLGFDIRLWTIGFSNKLLSKFGLVNIWKRSLQALKLIWFLQHKNHDWAATDRIWFLRATVLLTHLHPQHGAPWFWCTNNLYFLLFDMLSCFLQFQGSICSISSLHFPF